MRAIVCTEYGKPVELVELPDPVPGPGQVVVEVEAAGVNYVDGLMARGGYQIRPPLPFTPGFEVAGRLPDGTRVLAITGLGGFATHVLVPAAQAVPLPDGLDPVRAAAFAQSYCTAMYALERRAGLRRGERVLVLGAGGGVGLAAIQVARALGAEVLAAASTADKRERAAQAGADEVIGYEGLKDAARRWGVDVAVDPVGGSLSEQALRGLREGGRLMVIGFAAGDIPRLPANHVLLRNRAVVGVDWGAWSMSNAAENRAMLEELFSMPGIDPIPPRTRPLAEAGQAMDDLLNRRVTGKIVLIPGK
ncbi:NADPH:quinone oxidoreductase family protein [Planotetraspora phitsanulokensis]|uniref:NADPH:quinone oxidoreductase n=1 Tax=Planotetraspora phitsanulokensis TaxID=575192 RepID=A0A8J3U0I9_9ACTN|nr:NADPH:quinone oxidoreductase family protein [Planotetraspora phitsanulokensis]GII35672.1 NADPH:quinone oxidoreductase [Planotetraspora phitsanulokensis]